MLISMGVLLHLKWDHVSLDLRAIAGCTRGSVSPKASPIRRAH